MTGQTADPQMAYDALVNYRHTLRVGRSVGRTLYVQFGDEPSKDDLLIGQVDSAELAAWIVERVNR